MSTNQAHTDQIARIRYALQGEITKARADIIAQRTYEATIPLCQCDPDKGSHWQCEEEDAS